MENPDIVYYYVTFSIYNMLVAFLVPFFILLLINIVRLGGDVEVAVSEAISLTIIVMILLYVITALFNPAHLGFIYKVESSRTYIPDVCDLCDEAGRQKDENGLPLFTSYDEYREWYLDRNPVQPPEYSYTEDELALMASEYYKEHSIGSEPYLYNISYGEGLQVTITLYDENEVELEAYTIDRESLEGQNKYYNYVQFEPSP